MIDISNFDILWIRIVILYYLWSLEAIQWLYHPNIIRIVILYYLWSLDALDATDIENLSSDIWDIRVIGLFGFMKTIQIPENHPFIIVLLVGGWGKTLWKIWVKVNWDDEIPNISGKIKLMATKPPTRLQFAMENQHAYQVNIRYPLANTGKATGKSPLFEPEINDFCGHVHFSYVNFYHTVHTGSSLPYTTAIRETLDLRVSEKAPTAIVEFIPRIPRCKGLVFHCTTGLNNREVYIPKYSSVGLMKWITFHD